MGPKPCLGEKQKIQDMIQDKDIDGLQRLYLERYKAAVKQAGGVICAQLWTWLIQNFALPFTWYILCAIDGFKVWCFYPLRCVHGWWMVYQSNYPKQRITGWHGQSPGVWMHICAFRVLRLPYMYKNLAVVEKVPHDLVSKTYSQIQNSLCQISEAPHHSRNCRIYCSSVVQYAIHPGWGRCRSFKEVSSQSYAFASFPLLLWWWS